jgi:hypothetical protein
VLDDVKDLVCREKGALALHTDQHSWSVTQTFNKESDLVSMLLRPGMIVGDGARSSTGRTFIGLIHQDLCDPETLQQINHF